MRRAVRRAALTRNPLYRREDRIEGAALLVLPLLVAVLGAASALTGTAFYRYERAILAADLANRQRVPVLLLADTTTRVAERGGAAVVIRPPVEAKWTLPDGTRRHGAVYVDGDGHAGDTVWVWMDRSWSPAQPPPDATSVRMDAAVSGAVAFQLGGWLLIVGYCGVRARLNRWRLANWERDWATIEPRWRNLR